MVNFQPYTLDERLPIQILKLRSKYSDLFTPLRSVSKAQNELSEKLKETNVCLIEVFQQLELRNIEAIIKLRNESEKLNKNISSKMIKNALNIFIFDIKDKFPREEELENLLHILNFESVINDNLVCLPFSSSISAFNNYEKVYRVLLEKIKEEQSILQSFTKKEENFVAYVPIFNLGGHFLENLIREYTKKDINSFLFDFGGKHIEMFRGQISILLKLRNMLIKEYGKTFFYSFNSYIGRVSKTREHIPARDFLTVFVGFDCFGPSHKRYRLKKEIADKIKEEEKGKFKIFEKDNYLYRVYDKKEASKLTGTPNPNIGVKQYNAAEHVNELEKIKKEINEKSTCVKILEKKKEAFSIVSKVLKIEKDSLLTSKLLKFSK